MKKTEKWLFPFAWLGWCVLLLAVVLFGLIRFFMLREGGETVRVLWETLPAAVVLVLCAALLLFLQLRLSKSAKKLNASLSEIVVHISEGKEETPVNVCGPLVPLGETLAEEEDKLLAYLRKTVSAAELAARAGERLESARKLIRSVTPETLSFGGLRYGISAATQLSPAVGANFAEAFPLDGRRILLAVGDVWGSGLDAALFSSRIKSLLRAQISAGKTAAEALPAINNTLCEENGANFAATLFAAIFHLDSGELRFSNAGHFPPILTGDTVGFLRVKAGEPLGLYPDAQYSEEVFALLPGQGVFLYTDGAVNGSDGTKRFSYDRLLSTLKALAGSALDADSVTSGMTSALNEFCKETPDVSALMLSFPGGAHRLLRPTLSDKELLKEFLGEWLGNDPRKNSILPACEEIFTGIVNHAGARAIRLGCEREEKFITIRFTDDGEPFNPLQREENGELYGEEGVGTAIRRIGGEIFYRTKQELNILTVRFPTV